MAVGKEKTQTSQNQLLIKNPEVGKAHADLGQPKKGKDTKLRHDESALDFPGSDCDNFYELLIVSS